MSSPILIFPKTIAVERTQVTDQKQNKIKQKVPYDLQLNGFHVPMTQHHPRFTLVKTLTNSKFDFKGGKGQNTHESNTISHISNSTSMLKNKCFD